MTGDATVFVVDDDPAVLDSLHVLLTTMGLRVESYNSAEAFLDGYDPARKGCLVLDIRMPNMNGLELLEVMQRRRTLIPCIIMTAHGDIKLAVRAMKMGAVDFIEKPFKQEQIIDSIRAALEHDEMARSRELAVARFQENVGRLTDRETEVFRKMIEGKLNKVIAADLQISPRTVEIHRARVMEKLRIANISQLIRHAIAAGYE